MFKIFSSEKRKLAACSTQTIWQYFHIHFAVAKPFSPCSSSVRCGCACFICMFDEANYRLFFILTAVMWTLESMWASVVLIVEFSIGAKIQFTITDYSYIRFNTFVWYYHLCHGLRLLNQAVANKFAFSISFENLFCSPSARLFHSFIHSSACSFVRTFWNVPNINFAKKIKFQLCFE